MSPRSRNIGLGHLRAFDAVARHLNFRSAAEALSLTQPAVSRQIQALEADVGGALFERHTRAVSLTPAGWRLLQVVSPWLERLDISVRNIRSGLARQSVSITTFASFSSLWLIPKLEAFQRTHPGLDIRVDASDGFANLDNHDFDMALRYGSYEQMPKGAIRLFDEVTSPMLSPWLLPQGSSLRSSADFEPLTLIEMSDVTGNQVNYLTWEAWSRQMGHSPYQPAEIPLKSVHRNKPLSVIDRAEQTQSPPHARIRHLHREPLYAVHTRQFHSTEPPAAAHTRHGQ
jgi:DNA-binding transcriptional LysR family regulator